jgi:non-ribosomal peptide synthetase component E (peptide arylation enzyme)
MSCKVNNVILYNTETIEHYSKVGAWSNISLIDLFKDNVRKYKDEVCLIDPSNKEQLTGLKPDRMTYSQLENSVDVLATNFIKAGIKKDDVVVVQLPNITELVIAYLAISSAGGVISPVPMQWQRNELSHVIQQTNAKMFIGMDVFKNYQVTDVALQLQSEISCLKYIVSLNELRRMTRGEADKKALQALKPTANEVFTIQWTSGTEAAAKACPLTHNNQLFQGRCYQHLGLRERSNILCLPPLVNASGISAFFIPWLLSAGSLILHHPFDLDIFVQQVAAEKVNYFGMIPAMLNMLLKYPSNENLDLSSVNLIVTGSASPSAWSIQEFKRRWGMDICTIYGMNEGAVFASTVDLQAIPSNNRSGLYPWWGKKGITWPSEITNQSLSAIESKLVDDRGEEVIGNGDIGELKVKSPGIFSGYYKRQDLNNKIFDADGFMKTGDIFKITEIKYLIFFDRSKDIIVRGGINISAQEIENAVLKHPDITDAAAVPMFDEKLGEKVCIYIVARTGKSISLDDISSFLKSSEIAIYKFPEKVESVDEIPRTPTGKIIKSILKKRISIA